MRATRDAPRATLTMVSLLDIIGPVMVGPSCIWANASSPIAPGRRMTTITFSIVGQSSSARSALRLSGTIWPRR